MMGQGSPWWARVTMTGQGPEKSTTSQLQALLQNRDQRKGLCPHASGDPEEGRGGSASLSWGLRPEFRKEEGTVGTITRLFTSSSPLTSMSHRLSAWS